ncbi:response regulator transcription factor [Ancylobacter dichloromethanicus]|uniref:DNA-binding response regulator n=1 Tax=Ancylobacter dichloromethanicus TaxID=518825 RepID=A0A9W6J7Z0_9HYPH|nr:response regulator [Ancylobacter dichloromethanicus]MBS7554293.1 response regulator transcription factor [Ancylobacter dichloromethanicus]GLK71418.1 DNA-binding response regulator [Ancylobacter dichloromethanicus]
MREPAVYIVDDDPGLNASLAALFRSVGLKTELFQHPQPFLELAHISRPSCLLLDVRLPGINGIEVLEQVGRIGWTMPVVMISGHADVVMAVRALHAGARDFLEKPVNDTVLLQLVQHWIRWDSQNYSCELICDDIRAKLAMLTEREQSVLQCMLRGQPNKVAAHTLNLSVKAVEGHRINLLHKMGVQSPVELVRMVGSCPKATHSPMRCSREHAAGRNASLHDCPLARRSR